MNQSLSRFLTSVAFIMAATGFLSSHTQAQIIVAADFTGGNGTTSVDQFQGIAGGGWSNAWSFTGTDYTAGVVSTNPMDGNYLNITRPSTSTANGQLTRTIDNSVLNTANNHIVKFSVRLDSLASGQTLSIGGYSSGATSAWNWLIGSDSARWTVYNGLTLVPVTGVIPAAGHTYDFTVNVNMVDKNYTVMIQDGSLSYTSGILAYRNTSPVNDQRLLFSIGDSLAQSLNISIDKVSYTAVPEPGVTAFLVVAGVFLLVRLGKARQLRPLKA